MNKRFNYSAYTIINEVIANFYHKIRFVFFNFVHHYHSVSEPHRDGVISALIEGDAIDLKVRNFEPLRLCYSQRRRRRLCPFCLLRKAHFDT